VTQINTKLHTTKEYLDEYAILNKDEYIKRYIYLKAKGVGKCFGIDRIEGDLLLMNN